MLSVTELRSMLGSGGQAATGAGTFSAVVTRVDADGTTWCCVDGSSAPTPCATDMACSVGDVVTVRIADHRATVTGNATSPATDDGTANAAQSTAEVAQVAADVAGETADQALDAASIADERARVAAVAAASARESAASASQSALQALSNLAITQSVVDALGRDIDDFQTHIAMLDDGLHIVPTAGDYYAILGSEGLAVYSSSGELVGKFGDSMQVGASGGIHMEADATGLSFIDANGYKVAYIEVDSSTGESTFYMTRSVVVKDLTFGNWKWRERANGNMSLKWMGW